MIVAGNWKMNLLRSDAEKLARAVAEKSESLKKSEAWIAPTLTSLPATTPFQHAKMQVGAQNVHWSESGAFTGEVSAPMLKEAGCSFAIVGHSERRQHFAETDETVKNRATHALTHGLKVIVCIGETLEQREAGETEKVLKTQLTTGMDVGWDKLEPQIVVAYEPVWAIGTGKVASNEEIEKAHSFIKSELKTMGYARSIPVLYGGSVKPANFGEISKLENVDGALVGGASLKVDSFCELLDIAEQS